jgi:ferric-dicitrate binding protein FerR (iron transport regulator)
MTRTPKPKQLLEDACREIRSEQIPPGTTAEAASRVWGRIAAEAEAGRRQRLAAEADVDAIHGCEDFQKLIPAYLQGQLSEARKLLLEDHSRECLACRKALIAARTGASSPVERAAAVPMPRHMTRSSLRWAAAAAALAAVVLGGWIVPQLMPAPSVIAHVETVDGELYRVDGDMSTPLAAGDTVAPGEAVRTGKDGGAVVRLDDGSAVEMHARSELKVRPKRRGTTLDLIRGNVIVEAAKQGAGQLLVATSDCLVSVTGTVFAVNHGTKGSRVSVVEGEVKVRQQGRRDTLNPGQQVTTSSRITPVPVADEIAWSRNVDRYLTMLEELVEIERAVRANVPMPNARSSSRVLELTPSNTIVYAAIPNLGETFAEGYRVTVEEIRTSEIIGQWWQSNVVPNGIDTELERVFSTIEAFGETIGNEVVVTVQIDAATQEPTPLVMAPLSDPQRFETLLSEQLAILAEHAGEALGVRIIDSPAEAGQGQMDLWIAGDLLVASPEPTALARVAGLIADPASNQFRQGPFYDTLAQAYRSGIDWLVGADLGELVGTAADGSEHADALRQFGLLDVRHLVVEHSPGDAASTRALLTFDGPRRGVASWLAEPAPMGALELVSPDATVASGFVVKTPAQMVDELLELLGQMNPTFEADLAEVESEIGLSLRDDLAEPLGAEFAFAVDGPMLPTPAWKVVLEVYDSARLQHTLEELVARMNTEIAQLGDGGGFTPGAMILASTTDGGRTYHSLTTENLPLTIHYTFVDGYLLAAPLRAYLDTAIEQRDTGYTLVSSASFTELLPADAYTDFSGIVYQNLGSVLGPLSRGVMESVGQRLTEEQRAAFEAVTANLSATVTCAWGHRDRIEIATSTPGGLVSSRLAALIGGLGGPLGMHSLLDVTETAEHATTGS